MNYLKGFDGLRGISILLVVLTHVGLWDRWETDSFVQNNFNLFSGVAGVMIFFCISGFLITSLLLHEKERKGSINFKNFFIRRFLRLMPPLIIFYISIFILMVCGALPADYLALPISVFYLYNFVPRRFYTPELGHTWSLAVEEQFYFIWPFIISRIDRLKKGVYIAVSLIVICLIWSAINDFTFIFKGNPDHLSHYFFVERWFIPACLPIMTGALAALLLFYKRDFLSTYFSTKSTLFLLAILLYPIQLVLPIPQELQGLILPVSIATILLWINFNQQSLTVKFLEFKPLAYLGKISYGVYVYQGLFLRTGAGGKLAIQQFPLNIILTLFCAVISYHLLEKPILNYKSRFSS